MNYTEAEHDAIPVGIWYVIAIDTEECLVGTRAWFGTQCGMNGLIEIDCLAVERIQA